MANKPLSALSAGAPLDVADLFLTSQSGNSRKVTGQQFLDFTQKVPERVLADLGQLGKVTFKTASTLVTLDGASVDVANIIPASSIILAVSTRVRSALTGTLASFNVGVSGDASRFGGTIGIAAGSNNLGVVNPYATYSPTTLTIAANGGAGATNTDKIRVVAYFLSFATPLD